MSKQRRTRLRRFESLESRRLLDGHGVLGDSEPADLDQDGTVNFADFLKLSRNFGQDVASRAQGDIDGDGRVGFSDFLWLAETFGRGPGVASSDDSPGQSGEAPGRQPEHPREQLENASFKQRRSDFTASLNGTHDAPFKHVPADAEVVFHPVLLAGSLTESPSDSPSARIDPNTVDSAFRGVGSLEVTHPILGTFQCTGTVISETQVITAGHCFDYDVDGMPDDGLVGTFYLNVGGDLTSAHTVTNVFVHPDFTGFSVGGANDDIAIIEFATPLPAGLAIYPLNFDGMFEGQEVEIVGYGQSGHGDAGFTVLPTYSAKRTGRNNADLFVVDDEMEGSRVNEVFLYDFDGPNGGTGFLGGGSLGNDIETTVGGGDSGGPTFVQEDGVYTLVGLSTFNWELVPTTPPAGFFGSLGGGIILAPYADWIASVAPAAVPANNAPSFSSGGDVVVLEDAGLQLIPWATNVSANDLGQTLGFNVLSNSDSELFDVQPQVNPNGLLSFAFLPDANGRATITVNLQDDGGTQYNGVDTTVTESFTITATPVNDAPTFVLSGNVTVSQGSGTQLITDFTADFEAGASESGQGILGYVVVNDNETLFESQPTVDVNGQLTFTTDPNEFGQANLLVRVQDDGGTLDGGVDLSGAVPFTITVIPDFTDPPETIEFTLGGDLVVDEDAGMQIVPRFATELSSGITDFLVASDNETLFSEQPDIQAASGQLRFATAPDAFGTAVITVTAIDANGSEATAAEFQIFVNPVDDLVNGFVLPAFISERQLEFNEYLSSIEDFRRGDQLIARMNRAVEAMDADYEPAKFHLNSLLQQITASSNSNQLNSEDTEALLGITQSILDFISSEVGG